MNKLALACLFAVTLGALGLTNFVLYGRPAAITPVVASDRPSQLKLRMDEKTPPLSSSDPEGFSETFERPLFSPTRRKPIPMPVVEPTPPAEPLPAPAQEVSNPSPAPALLGVSVTQTVPRALLVANGKQEANWFRNGETIDDWTIAAITKEEVTLQRGEQSVRLSLHPSGTDAPPIKTGSHGQ